MPISLLSASQEGDRSWPTSRFSHQVWMDYPRRHRTRNGPEPRSQFSSRQHSSVGECQGGAAQILRYGGVWNRVPIRLSITGQQTLSRFGDKEYPEVGCQIPSAHHLACRRIQFNQKSRNGFKSTEEPATSF